ncbi:chemotaxis protein CheW [Ectothiorhodospiraceae bacterium WFHF3C12]|nr:chemotaxis protein CheW [Ectothiorhodospiraceae bacterium WFHF3C12]
MSKQNLAETRTLSDQKQALWDYLDALLQEVPEDDVEAAAPAARKPLFAEPEPETAEPVRAPVTRLRQPVTEPPAPAEPEVEVPGDDVPEVDVPREEEAEAFEAPIADEPEPQIETPAAEQAVEHPEPAEAEVPEWAEPDFQALIFHVGGLKLAVPLVKLHSVVPWEEQVTPMPNQPGWCHGLFNYRGHNVRVVDTAALVLPADKRAEAAADTPEQILVVGDGRWAMSCTRVGDVVRLKPGEVKWRTARGQRPWLAGTVREKLCAVMDTEAFADMLDRA